MSDTFDVNAPSADATFGEQMILPAPMRRRLPWGSGNMVLAILFAAGIAMVYTMSLRTGPAPASAAVAKTELTVETTLTQLTGLAASPNGKSQSAKDIVAGFYLEARQRQIPISSLRGNPFVFRRPAPASPQLLTATDSPLAQSDEPSLDTRAAMDAIKQLRLQSVLVGAQGRSTALISNNLLSEGQQIAGWTVSSIASKQVVLTWQDQTHVLKME